jgi:hypothetical protein
MEPKLSTHEVLGVKHDLEEVGYACQEHPAALGRLTVQWIRKDSLQGGAADAVQQMHAGNGDGYEHVPVLGIVFDVPHDFIQLLLRSDHDEDDDYPDLRTWIRSLEAGWRAAWNYRQDRRPRIILFLYQVLGALDRLWVNYQRNRRSDEQPPPTAEELHDAITWMLIEFQVECVHCDSPEDFSKHLVKMTRMLAEEPYQRQVTELECIKKLKAECSDMDPPDERATDCWLRQLQQVPRLSRNMASSLVQHYPTAMSLWLAYQDESLSEDEKRVLCADLFSDRRQVKLSDWLYRVMTSDNPDELLT